MKSIYLILLIIFQPCLDQRDVSNVVKRLKKIKFRNLCLLGNHYLATYHGKLLSIIVFYMIFLFLFSCLSLCVYLFQQISSCMMHTYMHIMQSNNYNQRSPAWLVWSKFQHYLIFANKRQYIVKMIIWSMPTSIGGCGLSLHSMY